MLCEPSVLNCELFRERSTVNILGLTEQQLKKTTDCIALLSVLLAIYIVLYMFPSLSGGWNEKPEDQKGGPGLFFDSWCNLEQVTPISRAGMHRPRSKSKQAYCSGLIPC